MFEYILEETLSSKDKKEIPDSMYGLTYTDENGNKIRKFPLNDESHVRQAAIFFDRAKDLSDDQKRELARNIVRRAKELDMDYSGWESLKPYLDKSVKESYDPDSTSGTSDFDDSDKEPDDLYCEYKSSLKDVELSKIEHLYLWSPVRFTPDNEKTSDIVIEHDGHKIFVTDKIGLCPFYTLYDSYIFEGIDKKYNADIDPVLPRDLDSLPDEESIVIKLRSPDATNKSGKFVLYVYEVNKDSVSIIKRDENYKTEYLYLIPKQNGCIRIFSKPVKTSHINYSIMPELPIRESFNDMFGEVIQEAFDAITGEEIPINHAYTMDEMKEKTFSKSELKHIKHDDELISVKRPNVDEVYFGSPINHMPEIDLDGPLFVTPLKGIASIFVGRDVVRGRIPKGSYNLGYKEFSYPNNRLKEPLKEVHVYVEGYPFLEPFSFEDEGYIHCIKTKDYADNFYRYEWMAGGDSEFLIANTDNIKVEFTRVIKCKVRYIVEGRPSPKGKQYGPSKGGILQYIHDIADKIHAKYKADQKEPTGNQNCLLCTWCAEASIRGGEYLPRPVYSPRDPALEIVPGDIVGGVTKKNPTSFHDMLKHLKDAKQPFARWYCHVKWGHSNGGHEFLIVKIDEDSFAIMDAQQGTVKPLNADSDYMKNVDWEGTYICRIDDKPFKYMKLDQINDPKKTLPWDPKKDIPYMVKHGLCTKEEAEKELKRTETNLFTSELKKSLKESPIQEGLFFNSKEYTAPQISEKYEEFTKAYSDPVFKSIIKDFKNQKSKDLVKYYNDRFPVDKREEWMDDADFDGTVVSFEKVIDDDLVETDNRYNPIGYMFATVKNSDEWLSISMVDGCVYYCNIRDNAKVSNSFNDFLKSFNGIFDKYLSKSKTIQEGAWQDIKNGVNPYSMKRVFHITKEGHLDGQIFKPRVPEYLDKYDPTKPNFEDVDSPRVCFSPSIEGCLNAILVNIGRWKTADKLGDWYVYIPEKPLKDYKHKTTRELIKDKKVYDANVTNEIWIEEPVRLKQYGIIHVDQVSDVSKKKTVPMLNGKSGERNKYNFKWHWLVKPKVLKNVPYEYTPKSVCEDMVMDLKRYNYGFVKNGKISKGSSEDYDKYYRLESPEEFEENGGGICYDYVEFQEGYLDAYGFKCKKYFIYTETEDNDTHTFMLVEDGDGKLIYPESSFKLLEGCHVVNDVQEAIRKITEQMFNINNNAKKYDEIPYYVWEYDGHPPYGSDMKTCHEYFTKGEPIYEGIAKK